ncbi:VOC family protein [Jatrophihabitans sp. YIM 134969]
MWNSINMSHVFVLDQEEAKTWYTEVLGLEVSADMDFGPMRWLTVRVPGTTGRDILLELPGAPGMDDASGAATRELVTKGATGFTFGLTTDDCHKTYETLKERGVEFTDPPTQQPYGIDCGARDPFGNHFRIVQPVMS